MCSLYLRRYYFFSISFISLPVIQASLKLEIHRPRTKYLDVEKANLTYRKQHKHTKEKREKDFVRQELARVRATAMEGSFGTQKEHYFLRRIKARKKETEILYIFFGIHTANAVELSGRIAVLQPATG